MVIFIHSKGRRVAKKRALPKDDDHDDGDRNRDRDRDRDSASTSKPLSNKPRMSVPKINKAQRLTFPGDDDDDDDDLVEGYDADYDTDDDYDQAVSDYDDENVDIVEASPLVYDDYDYQPFSDYNRLVNFDDVDEAGFDHDRQEVVASVDQVYDDIGDQYGNLIMEYHDDEYDAIELDSFPQINDDDDDVDDDDEVDGYDESGGIAAFTSSVVYYVDDIDFEDGYAYAIDSAASADQLYADHDHQDDNQDDDDDDDDHQVDNQDLEYYAIELVTSTPRIHDIHGSDDDDDDQDVSDDDDDDHDYQVDSSDEDF